MNTEEIIVASEYKHLKIYRDGVFLQGALVNSAKIERKDNLIRYYASLEGHKIIDTGFVAESDKYLHLIVEDEKSHQVTLRFSDIKTAYALCVKYSNDAGLSFRDKETILRLIVIFGGFVKRSKEL